MNSSLYIRSFVLLGTVYNNTLRGFIFPVE